MLETTQPNDRWVHRRRMTYTALWTLLAIAAGAFGVNLSEAQVTLLSAVSYMLGSIVGAYVGVKTWVEKGGPV